MPNDGSRYWHDALRLRRARVDEIARPETLVDVVDAVKSALARGKRVRADAAGHSFSDVAVPRDVLIDPKKMQVITQQSDRRVKVQTGVRIRDLVDWLNDRDLALANLGSYDLQTLPGAVSTGTHGSGIGLGGLPDLVEEVDLVDGHGERRRLTAADGDLFLAATCGLGALGVVMQLELQVQPTYDLVETTELSSWDEVRPRLLDGTLLTEARIVEVMVSPYEHRPTSGPYANRRIRPVLILRKAVAATGRKRRGHRPLLPAIALLFGDVTADVVLSMVRMDPLQLPEVHYDACRQSVGGEYVDRWDRVLLQDVSQVPATSIEVGVPVERTVEAMELVFEQIARFRAAGWWHTSPMNLRFVAASARTLIAPYTGRATCMIEIPQLTGTPGAEAMFAAYERLLISRVQGRPHWGKLHQLVGTEFPLGQVHPQIARFRAARDELDPQRRFANAMTERIGL